MAFSTGSMSVGINLSSVDTTPQFPLGKLCVGDDGATYRYVRANSAVALGDLLKHASGQAAHTVVPTAAVTDHAVGVAPLAIASGSYGWAIVQGVATAKVAASTAALAAIAASATAGTGSAVTVSATPTQAEVQRAVVGAAGVGIVSLTAEAGGLATVLLT